MKNFKEIKKHGMHLRIFNIIMFFMALAITVAMFVAMQRTTALYDETSSITQDVVELRENAYNLQVASDYLTEQIRCFALTGEEKYMENYFTEAFETRRRDIALEAIEKEVGDTAAFKSLNEAMVGSIELMDTEYYAARLIISAYGINEAHFPDFPGDVELTVHDMSMTNEEKISRAQELLFNEAYRSKKESIAASMRKCLTELTDELGVEQQELSAQLKEQVFLEHVLTVLLIVIMLGIIITTTIMVINPLMKFVELIRREKALPIKGAYEVRFLAKNYNLIYYTNLKNREKLEYEASHDKMTGLYNRRGYDFLIENIDVETSALMIVDLDRFKQINDKNGHDIGDKVLIRVAEALSKSFMHHGLICRLGGDEFVVIFTHVDRASSRVRIEKKIKKINEKLEKAIKDVPGITVSVGVAYGTAGMDTDTLFKEADTALYDVKDGGRNNVAFYN